MFIGDTQDFVSTINIIEKSLDDYGHEAEWITSANR